MRPKKDKGPLRNFYFLKEADDALVRYAQESGQDMVVVVEDLLLGRRQFSSRVDSLIDMIANSLGITREQAIIIATVDYLKKELLHGASIDPCRSRGRPAATT